MTEAELKAIDAIEEVLQQTGQPLTAKEITDLILSQGLWFTQGTTPEATIEARLSVDIKQLGSKSRFQRTQKRIFALRSWGLPEYRGKPFTKKAVQGKVVQTTTRVVPHSKTPTKPTSVHTSATTTLSFTDAAERILDQVTNKQPMHYRDLTAKALASGLLSTRGQTPEQTMYAQILTEIDRNMKRGETGRFTKHGRGLIGLTRWIDVGLAGEIEQHNNAVRRSLRERLYKMSPAEFEDLVGSLLIKIGFENVQVVGRSGDGGIDVKGTLVVAGVIRTNMAVQAKRWKQNVQAPIVQQVRGSLGTHDQGLIITTSDFSSGARQEAERTNAVPVALMNGEELVGLLVEHNLMITRTSYDLIELEEPTDE